VSLTAGLKIALVAGFLVVTALLVLTAVTLVSQRQRTVLLNRQLATLVDEATAALHGAAPLLASVPARSSTVRSRADSLAALVSETRPLVGQLNAGGLASTLSATGQLVASLEQQGRLSTTLDDLGTLAASADQSGLVPRLVRGLQDVGELVSLQVRALRVGQATLANGRSARAISQRTLTVAQTTLAAARRILSVAQQTLTHAASLDHKVGAVP
jgi:hypothetical protein